MKRNSEMSIYNVDICGDTLSVSFGEPANNDQIVVEVKAKIARLIEIGQIRGGRLLKITGRQSLPVAYTICHEVAHLYGAIAVFDPKMGGKGLDAYIVVISHTKDYQVGQILTDPNDLNVPLLKIALCGPPHSGKSCLREGLKTAILQLTTQAPYILTACNDGEGAWFCEATIDDPERAAKLKDMNKGRFTSEHAELFAGWVRGLSISALIDCGGQMSTENDQILAEATHAIVLAGDALDEKNEPLVNSYQARLQKWVKYCKGMGLTVIAEIHSDYHAKADRIDTPSPLTGMVHRLERGEDVSDRPMIQALAKSILQLIVDSDTSLLSVRRNEPKPTTI